MSDFPIQNSCESRINEAVCVDTKRVYDSCVSKDCLENLRVSFNEAAQTIIDSAATVKARDCEIVSVSIDLEEVPFNRGYYSTDINYYFRIRFDTYSEPGTTPQVVYGYTNFEKKCILFGSEGNVKTFTSELANGELDIPEAPQYTSPTAKVQAVDPVILDLEVLPVSEATAYPLITSFPASIREAMGGDVAVDGEKAVLSTLGLFSIIQMSRDVQIMIHAYDFCIPERECDCSTQSPCDNFQDIDFPVDEFFPPDREDGCSCGGNN